jgi:hypothetical protein
MLRDLLVILGVLGSIALMFVVAYIEARRRNPALWEIDKHHDREVKGGKQ